MTTQQNRIMMPSNRQVKVVINLDPHTGQTDVRVTQGQITHIQLLGLLLEHSTAMLKNMIAMQQKPILHDDSTIVIDGDKEESNAS